MILSDADLGDALRNDHLRVSPFRVEALQPASIDLKLHNKFRVFNKTIHSVIDPSVEQPNLTTEVAIPVNGKFVIHPGQFVLASTYERIELNSKMAAMVEGISSLGRLGLVVHATAGFIDPGFKGNITLEMSNISGLPILLTSQMRIAQLVVFFLNQKALTPYGHPMLKSKYQGQAGPTESKSWKDNNA